MEISPVEWVWTDVKSGLGEPKTGSLQHSEAHPQVCSCQRRLCHALEAANLTGRAGGTSPVPKSPEKWLFQKNWSFTNTSVTLDKLLTARPLEVTEKGMASVHCPAALLPQE